MTELQKKIRKTSRFTAAVFSYLCIFPASSVFLSCFNLYGLLGGATNISLRIAGQAPNGSRNELIMFTLCMILIYTLATWGMILARNIFHQIAQEYTPFNPTHVKRMRKIALISIFCILGKALLEGWALSMQGGSFAPDFNLAWFLLPLVVCSFSFILDYACQLQAEADTTL